MLSELVSHRTKFPDDIEQLIQQLLNETEERLRVIMDEVMLYRDAEIFNKGFKTGIEKAQERY